MSNLSLKNNPISNFLAYRKSPLHFLHSKINSFGKIAVLNILGKKVFLISNPVDVEYVLAKNAKNYIKGRTTQKLSKIIGNGLITSEGELWKNQNRLIRRSFSIPNVEVLGSTFLRHLDQLLHDWEKKESIDIIEEMYRLTLSIILDTLFKQNIFLKKDSLFHDVDFLLNYMIKLIRSPNPLKSFLPTRENRKFKEIMKKWNQLIDSMIESEIKNSSENGETSLLSILLNQENLKEMSRELIRDEIMTLLFAGHETMTNSLAWTFILLTKNPCYFLPLRTQAQQFFMESQFKELQKDSFAKCVLSEGMRLYPPVWSTMRESIGSDVIDNVSIPKKSIVVLGIYYTHRLEEFWDRATDFYPERFGHEPNPNANISGIKYYPFGHGPRACIGNHMAYLEGQLTLLKICEKYEFMFDSPYEEQQFDPGLTLRPLNNRRLKLIKIKI